MTQGGHVHIPQYHKIMAVNSLFDTHGVADYIVTKWERVNLLRIADIVVLQKKSSEVFQQVA